MEDLLARMRTAMLVRDKRPNTRATYVRCIERFGTFLQGRDPATLCPDDLEAYLVHLMRDGGLSGRSRNVHAAALRFLYRLVLRQPEVVSTLGHVKCPRNAPEVLTRTEIAQLLAAFTSVAHQTIAMLCYGAGFRVSEAVELRIADVHSQRGVLFIAHGKGGKQREVPLGGRLLGQLRHYYRQRRPRGPYMFPGRWGRLHLTRTAALGGHLDVCDRCGLTRPSYNSCRDRHCPKCQAVAQHRWLEARRRRTLPVHHFHVVFTLPAELRALVRCNGSALYDTLFRAATSTLLTLGRDPARLGARLGITAVLHTWSRDLSFHPHLHCVVTGGGLHDDGRWKPTRPGYLFPVRVLGKLFRGRFLAAVRDLRRRGRLRLDGLGELAEPGRLLALVDRLHQKPWLVYCKPPFGSADAVYQYLGRYTHRIAISNRRIVDIRPDAVTFVTRDGKTTSLPPQTFMRRFLSHVLPRGFVRIRHYGLLASSHVHSSLQTARRALTDAGSHRPSPPVDDADPRDDDDTFIGILRRLTGLDLRRCPRCRNRSMRPRALPIPGATVARGPPR